LYRAATGALTIGALVGMSAAEAACATPRLNATANKLADLKRMVPTPNYSYRCRTVWVPGRLRQALQANIEPFSGDFASNPGPVVVE
jgi:hypothetical protein